jgi:D-alanine-D-alanine ligase
MQTDALRVGLTYDLRADYLAEGYGLEETAEFDKPDTIEGLEAALRTHGFQPERIGNAQALVNALARGQRWDIVFNIAEGLHGVAREALVPALLDAYRIPYTFSGPDTLVVALDKALTKTVAREAGVPTAPFAVLRAAADAERVQLPYPLFLKPVAEGTGKGVSERSKARDAGAMRAVAAELLARFHQPVLVETYLPGREFTIGIEGDGARAAALGVIEVIFRPGVERIYSYQTKTDYERLVSYAAPHDATAQAACAVALAAWRALGCVDAGRVDVRCDAEDRPQFIEVNPLAGLNPTHSDLPILCRMHGIAYDDLIGRVMRHALRRHGLRA